jgi:hypothetical protein
MLPVYKAIDVKNVISEKAGHTRPWVVLAETPEGLKSFVVKLYSTEQVDLFHCVTKEVVCNLLAIEFDLKVPQCVLIELPEDLVLNLPSQLQQQYNNADYRLKFATQYFDNVISATKEIPSKVYKKRIVMDTLFAFDNLIRNGDRGQNKTNLLLSPDNAFLIDHERALSTNDIVNIYLETLQLEDRFTKYHLFYPYLKDARGKNKYNFFNDFNEYLRFLNLNKLTQYFNKLVNEGFYDYSQPITAWLNNVKQNSTIFVNKLKGAVQ